MFSSRPLRMSIDFEANCSILWATDSFIVLVRLEDRELYICSPRALTSLWTIVLVVDGLAPGVGAPGAVAAAVFATTWFGDFFCNDRNKMNC